MEKGKKWDLISIASIPLIMTLGNSMLIPVLPAIRSKLGISSLQVSLMITVYSAIAIVLIPIAGYMSDKFGRKVVILPSLLIAGIGGSQPFVWWLPFWHCLPFVRSRKVNSANKAKSMQRHIEIREG